MLKSTNRCVKSLPIKIYVFDLKNNFFRHHTSLSLLLSNAMLGVGLKSFFSNFHFSVLVLIKG
jgi:hypothetical protein